MARTSRRRAAPRRAQVLVAGGGIAGLTLAVALGRARVETILVDRESEAARTAEGYDERTTAIALGSQRILAGLDAWPRLVPHAEPILDIRIADGAAPVFLHYDHREVGDQPFGWIVENRLLRRALFEELAELPAVTAISGQALAGAERGPAGVTARLADGSSLAADLLVAADGKGSALRAAAEIPTVSWRYRQKAIVCVIGHDEPHGGLAVEHFYPSGPFAVLPMTDDPTVGNGGGHRSSIVWTERSDRVDALVGLPDDAFTAELQRRIGFHRGAVRLRGRRAVFPLGVVLAQRYVAERLALIGDAAHAVHPIAGQGLNMGLRDVAALAEIIVDGARLGLDPGQPDRLEAYQRWRRFDNLTLVAVTDSLNRLFSTAKAPVRAARDLGLVAVGRLPPLKRFFMRHAMGIVGPLPRLIRGEPL